MNFMMMLSGAMTIAVSLDGYLKDSISWWLMGVGIGAAAIIFSSVRAALSEFLPRRRH